jgi:hypothetical protein
MLGRRSMRQLKQLGLTDLCVTCVSDGVMHLWDLCHVGGKGEDASIRFN